MKTATKYPQSTIEIAQEAMLDRSHKLNCNSESQAFVDPDFCRCGGYTFITSVLTIVRIDHEEVFSGWIAADVWKEWWKNYRDD